MAEITEVIPCNTSTVIYKYQTELKASDLSTQLGHFSSEGLCDIDYTYSNDSLKMNSCSLLVQPQRENDNDSNVRRPSDHLIKVTCYNMTISNLSDKISSGKRFLIYRYVSSTQSSYKGEFLLVNEDYVKNTSNKFVLIGGITIWSHQGTQLASIVGGDWSDVGVMKKGLNPQMWLSVSSPRRKGNNFLNFIEVRSHNDLLSRHILRRDGDTTTLYVTPTCDYEYASGHVHYFFNSNGVLSFSLNGKDIDGLYLGSRKPEPNKPRCEFEILADVQNNPIQSIKKSDADTILFKKGTIYFVRNDEATDEMGVR